MCGILASLGVMTWIIYGVHSATYNKELKLVNKNVSVTGCPANITILDGANYTG